jgi:F-type H+-transporting ATPase subunit delta
LATNTLQSRRYAQAIFELAIEKKELEKFQADLKRIWALSQNADFASVMDNPKYTFEAKSKLFLGYFKDLTPLVLNFAYLLTRQGRFALISDIYTEFQRLVDIYKGVELAQVITAVPLDGKDASQLAENLGRLTGKKVTLEPQVDNSILGGMVVRVGGKLLDGSISSRLAALKSELAGTGA